MKNFKALVKYFDNRANLMRTIWVTVEADSMAEAWAESKASFTTLDVICD